SLQSQLGYPSERVPWGGGGGGGLSAGDSRRYKDDGGRRAGPARPTGGKGGGVHEGREVDTNRTKVKGRKARRTARSKRGQEKRRLKPCGYRGRHADRAAWLQGRGTDRGRRPRLQRAGRKGGGRDNDGGWIPSSDSGIEPYNAAARSGHDEAWPERCYRAR